MTTSYLLPAIALALLTACTDRTQTVTGPGRVDTVYVHYTGTPETGIDSGTVFSATGSGSNQVEFSIDTANIDTAMHAYTGAIYVDFAFDGYGQYCMHTIQSMAMSGGLWRVRCYGMASDKGRFKMPWVRKNRG